jgi:3-oxoacyl-[acyl-carrier protein] reductase
MNLDLSDRRALVCGGSGGIGLACARELALLGAHVTLIARDLAKLERAVASLPRPRAQTHNFIVADLGVPEAVRSAVAPHLEAGERPLLPLPTILINNTGGPPGGTALEAKPADLLACFSAQLLTAHALVQLLLPSFRSAGFGRIINIASTSVKQPIPNLAISNIVRPAVAAWAKCLSVELAPLGVTVNNLLPGYTVTDRLESIVNTRAAKQGSSPDKVKADIIAATPAGRFATPEEIGAAAAFLASPAAAYINGINLPVDGGRLATL